jgi:hypothetical protein
MLPLKHRFNAEIIMTTTIWNSQRKFYKLYKYNINIAHNKAIVFGRLKYIPRLFSEYMLTFMVEDPMKICVATKSVILYVIQLSERVYNVTFPLYMKYDVTPILTSLKNDVKGTETDI